MNIIQLFEDYNVQYYTTGYKYCRAGWINVDCPFCQGNPGPHLGFHLETNHFHCWRCKAHFNDVTIAALLHVNLYDAKQIIRQYGGKTTNIKTVDKVKVNLKSFKFPSNSNELQNIHRKYLLESRSFDPDFLIKTWGLLGTTFSSKLSTGVSLNRKILDYRFRIIIPFEWDNKIVSFDSRDVTGQHIAKYMACPADREIISHKDIVFGKQSAWGSTGICVEGPFDVFRFGINSFATSGIEYTPAQVRIMAKQFKRVAVCYDGPSGTSQEAQAENKAKDLIAELKFRNVDAFRVKFDGDPGEMNQNDANYLVKQLI
jgi:transposase-like protein